MLRGRGVHIEQRFLTTKHERALLGIARESLKRWLTDRTLLELASEQLSGPMNAGHCAFVSLHRGDELRGCVGYTTSRGPLAAAVRDNVINAATDPRFLAVGLDELDTLTIEVSALTIGEPPDTPFRRVMEMNEIFIGRDGLFVRRGAHRGGLLLPQVAVQYGWESAQFLTAVCRKAGYEEDAWRQGDLEIYRFGAQVFSEAEL